MSPNTYHDEELHRREEQTKSVFLTKNKASIYNRAIQYLERDEGDEDPSSEFLSLFDINGVLEIIEFLIL